MYQQEQGEYEENKMKVLTQEVQNITLDRFDYYSWILFCDIGFNVLLWTS